MKLSEGELAPRFKTDSTQGEILLENFKDKNVILYFYPKDMTPGCTIQAEDFSSLYSEFDQLDTVILGVSKDSLELHHQFCNKKNIPYPLLYDPDGIICNLYGVIKEKTMFGKKYMGIVRTTVLINKTQEIVKIWHNVKPKGHAQNVLKTIKILSLIKS